MKRIAVIFTLSFLLCFAAGSQARPYYGRPYCHHYCPPPRPVFYAGFYCRPHIRVWVPGYWVFNRWHRRIWIAGYWR